ncbi:MAG: GAF domain-containing sensor histidine kinase [Puniceicoccaceae bacterium]
MKIDESGTNVRFLDYASTNGSDEWVSDKEHEILDQINRKVAAHTSLESIIDFVFESMQPIRSSDRLGLALIDRNGKRVVLRHVIADYSPLRLNKGYLGDLGEGTLKQVVEDKVIRIINDLQEYHKAHPESKSSNLILKEGIRSSMTCPLFVEDNCVGLIFWSSRKPNMYDDQVVRRHQAVAERLSQAVGNAYLIEQLKNVNNAYMDMLGFVSHELKDPIAAIITNANLLHDGYLGELSPDQKEKLARMQSKAEYLLGIVRQYLNLARIEAGKIEPFLVKVDDMVTKIVEPSISMSVPESPQGRILECAYPKEEIALECDPDQIMIVLTNLISNAYKYGSKDGKVRIQVDAMESSVSVSVYNEGPGFSEEDSKRLFRRFSRLPAHQRSGKIGTGVGLYLAWCIITSHGGSIRAESKEGEWAKFSFVLPLTAKNT